MRALLRSLALLLAVLAALPSQPADSAHCERGHGAPAAAHHDVGHHEAPPATDDGECPHCPAATCAVAVPCAGAPGGALLAGASLPAATVAAVPASAYPPVRRLPSRAPAPPVPPPDLRLA